MINYIQLTKSCEYTSMENRFRNVLYLVNPFNDGVVKNKKTDSYFTGKVTK